MQRMAAGDAALAAEPPARPYAPPSLAAIPAVVLAAGSGERLHPQLKPLARVAGLTLLERCVRTLQQAGILDIVVVVGHGSDQVRAEVEARGLDVALVEHPGYLAGNGSSALAGGRGTMSERFLVVMVDHVFDAEEVAAVAAAPGVFVAAVDSAPAYCDVDDATKVRLEHGRVTDVARVLPGYDGVDAGLFVCDVAVLECAERSLAAGDASWNDVKRRWLDEGGAIDAVDLRGAFWIDVDTPEEVRRAERLLVARAAAKPLDGVVARLLNRRLSRPVTRRLVRTRLTPTGATVATFVLTLVAAAALAAGALTPWALVAGGLLVQAASVADGIDGELARAKLRFSPAGAFLDTVLDRLGEAAVLTGLAVAAGLTHGAWAGLAAALLGALLGPYVKASFESAFRRPFPADVYRRGFGHDARLLVAALGAVTLQPLIALWAVAAIAAAETARRMLGGWRAARAEEAASRTVLAAPRPMLPPWSPPSSSFADTGTSSETSSSAT